MILLERDHKTRGSYTFRELMNVEIHSKGNPLAHFETFT